MPAMFGTGRMVNGQWVPDAPEQPATTIPRQPQGNVPIVGAPSSTPGVMVNSGTGSSGSIFPVIHWGGGGGPIFGGGSTRPPTTPIVTGTTFPGTTGQYPAQPVPFPTLPSMPTPTSPTYIGGPNPGSSAPPSSYNPNYNPLADIPDAPTAPDIGTYNGSHAAQDWLTNFLNTKGYEVSAVDPNSDPMIAAQMNAIRNSAANSALAAAHRYQTATGQQQSSAGGAAMRTALRLAGASSGLRDSNAYGLDASKYLTGLKQDAITKALQGAGLLGTQENAAGELFYKGQGQRIDSYNAQINALRAALEKAGLGMTANENTLKDWLAIQDNNRGNQGTYDAHYQQQLAQYNASVQQALAAYQLQIQQQQLADERERQRVLGALGPGTITYNPDGTTTTHLPVSTTGVTGTPGGGTVGGGTVSGGTVPGGTTGGGGGGVIFNANASPTSAAHLGSQIQTLASQIANIQGRPDPTNSQGDQVNNMRVKLGVLQALADGKTGAAYESIRQKVLALADGDLSNYSANRSQIINLLATLGTSLNGRIPTYFGMAGGDTEQAVRQPSLPATGTIQGQQQPAAQPQQPRLQLGGPAINLNPNGGQQLPSSQWHW